MHPASPILLPRSVLWLLAKRLVVVLRKTRYLLPLSDLFVLRVHANHASASIQLSVLGGLQGSEIQYLLYPSLCL